VIAKMKGTFTERPKKPKAEGEPKKKKKKENKQLAAAPAAGFSGAPGYGYPAAGSGAGVPEQPPNQILFLTNLPEETNEMMLQMLFTQ